MDGSYKRIQRHLPASSRQLRCLRNMVDVLTGQADFLSHLGYRSLMGSSTGSPGDDAVRATHDAAVIGVVLAGVLASFVIPGPFDWGSTLIGVILLLVLVAYGGVPRGTGAGRRGLGMAAAAAFCLVLVLGRPFDEILHLTQWPADEADPSKLARRDEARPNPDAGVELGLFWLTLFLLCYSAGAAYAKWIRS